MTRFLSAGLRQPWFDRVRLSPLPYLGSERCSCRHSSARASEARRFGNAQAITRCGEPMQLQLWVRIFAQNRTEERAIAGPRAFNGLCDDEGVPLICPTCQVLAQSVLAGDRLLLCMGLFSIFLVGSHNDTAWLRESRLKPHAPARPSLYRSGAPDTIRTCDLCLRRATLYPAELRVRMGHPLADWPGHGNGSAGRGRVGQACAGCGLFGAARPVNWGRRSAGTVALS